jgi:hypothetical protein
MFDNFPVLKFRDADGHDTDLPFEVITLLPDSKISSLVNFRFLKRMEAAEYRFKSIPLPNWPQGKPEP